MQLYQLQELSGFVADADCEDIAGNTTLAWMGGLTHPLGPQRDSAQDQLSYATLMTVCEATVHDQVDVFQSELSLEAVKLVPEEEDIGFRYAPIICELASRFITDKMNLGSHGLISY